MKKTFLALTAVGLLLQGSARAELLAYWNFNDNTSAATLSAADGGLQVATAALDLSNIGTFMSTNPSNGNYSTFAGTTSNGIAGETAGQALAVVGALNNSHYVTFSLSMTGYAGLDISYATRTSGTTTGFTSQQWSYSFDNISFTNFGTAASGYNTSFSVFDLDTTALSVLDNAPTVYLRATFAGATSTTSNNRLDNVQFTAVTAVPEPHEYAIAFASLLGLLIVVRRRQAAQITA